MTTYGDKIRQNRSKLKSKSTQTKTDLKSHVQIHTCIFTPIKIRTDTHRPRTQICSPEIVISFMRLTWKCVSAHLCACQSQVSRSKVSRSKDYVCLVLNKSWFWLMLVHTCVSECDRNAGYNLYASWGQWGGVEGGGILFESEFRSCVKVQVAVLGSPSLTVLMDSVDVKLHWTWTFLKMFLWCSSSTLYLLACQVRVTVGNSGRCCCVCVTSFEY